MMVISQQVFDAMSATRFRQFLKRLEEFTLQLRPELAARATPESIAEFAEFATGEARELEFTTEFEIAVFCAALLLKGRGCYVDISHPLFSLVTSRDTDPRLRALRLLDELEPQTDGLRADA